MRSGRILENNKRIYEFKTEGMNNSDSVLLSDGFMSGITFKKKITEVNSDHWNIYFSFYPETDDANGGIGGYIDYGKLWIE